MLAYVDYPNSRRPSFGLHASVGGLIGRDLRVGGFAGALRIRPIPALAVDIGTGIYGGSDYNDRERWEIPITTDLIVFLNPSSPLQVYLVGGLGLSFAHVRGYNERLDRADPERDYVYIGGQAGVGLEWRIAQWFAIHGDIRGFLRKRLDGDGGPEFIDPASGDSTNASGGGLVNLGVTFYFR